MSTIVDLLKAGLNVKAAGVVPAKSIYTPEKSDRTFYTLKIASFGRTIRVGFESEADLAAAPDIGTEIRLQAPMSREDRGYGAVIKGSQSVLSVAGREGWEGPLTETEIMGGRGGRGRNAGDSSEIAGFRTETRLVRDAAAALDGGCCAIRALRGACPKRRGRRRGKDAQRYFFEYFDGNVMISALDRTAVAPGGGRIATIICFRTFAVVVRSIIVATSRIARCVARRRRRNIGQKQGTARGRVAEGMPDETLEFLFGNSSKIRIKYYAASRKGDCDRVPALRFDRDERAELLRRLFPLVAENDAAGRFEGERSPATGISARNYFFVRLGSSSFGGVRGVGDPPDVLAVADRLQVSVNS